LLFEARKQLLPIILLSVENIKMQMPGTGEMLIMIELLASSPKEAIPALNAQQALYKVFSAYQTSDCRGL